MADFARKGKQEKKALPLFPLTDRCHDNPGALEKKLSASRVRARLLTDKWGKVVRQAAMSRH